MSMENGFLGHGVPQSDNLSLAFTAPQGSS
jgi:hypothetical protein